MNDTEYVIGYCDNSKEDHLQWIYIEDSNFFNELKSDIEENQPQIPCVEAKKLPIQLFFDKYAVALNSHDNQGILWFVF